MKRLITSALLLLVLLSGLIPASHAVRAATADDFGDVVKVIEDFYHVKHKGIPFLGRAGLKAATVAARVAGGNKKRLAEAGSVKVAYFEDQDFSSLEGLVNFRRALKGTLVPAWLPFIQVLSPNTEEQTYVFLRDAGPKFHVLVVTIEKNDASVVQVSLAPQTLAMLMQNPNEMGKAITDDATLEDN
ncbi:MAG: hypothetical protein ABI967_05055 [bacterium]